MNLKNEHACLFQLSQESEDHPGSRKTLVKPRQWGWGVGEWGAGVLGWVGVGWDM